MSLCALRTRTNNWFITVFWVSVPCVEKCAPVCSRGLGLVPVVRTCNPESALAEPGHAQPHRPVPVWLLMLYRFRSYVPIHKWTGIVTCFSGCCNDSASKLQASRAAQSALLCSFLRSILAFDSFEDFEGFGKFLGVLLFIDPAFRAVKTLYTLKKTLKIPQTFKTNQQNIE